VNRAAPEPAALRDARAAVAEARAAFRRGEREAANAALDRVPGLLGDTDDAEASAVQLDAVALRAFHAGNLERCLSAQTAAIAVYRRIGDRPRLAEALVRDAGARMVAGRAEVAERLAEARREADTIGDASLVAQIATTAAMQAMRDAQAGEALTQAAVAAAAGRRAGAWTWVLAAEGTGAAAAMALGDAHACIAMTTRAIEDAVRQGLGRATLDLGLQRVRALAAVGDAAEAALQLDELAARLHPDDRCLQAKRWLAAGLVHRAAADHAAADAALRRAHAAFVQIQDRVQAAETLAALVENDVQRGDVDATQAHLTALRLADPPAPLRTLAEARAAMLLALPEDALAHALEAARAADAVSAPLLGDDARVLAVQAARASGDLALALALCEDLAEARAQANRLRRRLQVRGSAAARAYVDAAHALDRRTAEGPASDALRALRQEHGARIDALAHAARNRLAAVTACGDLLALPTPPRPREELADRLHAAVASLSQMLDDAATEARDPGATGAPEPTPVAPLAYRVASIFGPRAAQKGIDLQVRVRSAGQAQVPPALLRDALENLVSNALKFCSGGDRVRILVDRAEGSVVVAVEDDGPGIPEREQPLLFQPRSRLSLRPTDGESSTGLGLWLTKAAIERAGGTVDVDTAPGRGSTFRLHLPGA
jgi:signal transduction histidine kinase